jgi:hypothetical protein
MLAAVAAAAAQVHLPRTPLEWLATLVVIACQPFVPFRLLMTSRLLLLVNLSFRFAF